MSEKMGKAALIAAIHEQLPDIDKKSITAVINTTLNVIGAELQKGHPVTLTGFGSFKVNKVKAHKGVNPQTMEDIKVPASNRVRFSVGKPLKDLVNTKPKKAKSTKVDLTKKKKKTT